MVGNDGIIEQVTTDGITNIIIPFELYNSLLEIKGRYNEIKDSEKDDKDFINEYKELLIIKGKYEELSAMFDSQNIDTSYNLQNPGIMPLSMNDDVSEYCSNDIKMTSKLSNKKGKKEN